MHFGGLACVLQGRNTLDRLGRLRNPFLARSPLPRAAFTVLSQKCECFVASSPLSSASLLFRPLNNRAFACNLRRSATLRSVFQKLMIMKRGAVNSPQTQWHSPTRGSWPGSWTQRRVPLVQDDDTRIARFEVHHLGSAIRRYT